MVQSLSVETGLGFGPTQSVCCPSQRPSVRDLYQNRAWAIVVVSGRTKVSLWDPCFAAALVAKLGESLTPFQRSNLQQNNDTSVSSSAVVGLHAN